MGLEKLGYNNETERLITKQKLPDFETARVISEHKERYIVKAENGEFEAEVIGSMRYTASSRNDFPAVGDWVAVSIYDSDKAIIHAVYPRKNKLERQAVGKFGEKQIIASNIDYALIVQSVNRDFSLNRVERYLTICNAANIQAVIVLNKIDLISVEALQAIHTSITKRIKHIPTVYISNETKAGFEELNNYIRKGKTYCLLGSSGVGKSTMINKLAGKNLMQTDTISESAQRGRHITSHRQLFVLDNGSIIIDNPGMREVGITNAEQSVDLTFDKITELAENCKFKNCIHINEKDCAVKEAVKNGIIEQSTYENYLKLQKEQQYFETDSYEKRKKDKNFGKMMKHYKKNKPK